MGAKWGETPPKSCPGRLRMQYSKEPPDRAHMQRVVRRSLPLLLFMVPRRPADGRRAARQQLWRCPRTRCPLARWPPSLSPSLPPRTHASQISRVASNARGPKHQNGRPTVVRRFICLLAQQAAFVHDFVSSAPCHSHSRNDGIIFVQSRTCELSCKHSTKSTAKTNE